MMPNVQKGPLCSLRSTQAQISLRISAGWSGPLLPSYRIGGECSDQIAWMLMPGPSLFAYDIRALFPRWALYILCHLGREKRVPLDLSSEDSYQSACPCSLRGCQNSLNTTWEQILFCYLYHFQKGFGVQNSYQEVTKVDFLQNNGDN